MDLNVLSPVSCDGCGLCCSFIKTPPHRVRWGAGEAGPSPRDPADSIDCERLIAAPAEAKRLYVESRTQETLEDGPCVWFDRNSKQCRFYEFRPTACRIFETGGEGCRMLLKAFAP